MPATPPRRRVAPVFVLLLLLAGLSAAAYGLWWGLQHDALLWLARANTWLADNVIGHLGYLGVFLLMAIESSFVPFPSEIVMPPAGDLARRSAEWSLGGVIAAGVLGSLAGAWINYGLARALGRPVLLHLIERWGGWFRLSVAAYHSAEDHFLRHGEIATLTGRLIPGIRQIISLPAGLARMNLAAFSFLTALGAGAWVTLLAWLGYRFGADAALLSESLKRYSLWLALGAVALLGAYGVWRVMRRRRATS